MSIKHVEVHDFQSLKHVSMDLGKLSVVVGASNSGKSALLRAIKAVVTNVNSPSLILRHGQKKAVVRLGVDDAVVQLERGVALSRYAVELRDDEPAVYAKAGTTVPDDVAGLMRFASIEGEDLNFSLQFDRPFLLDAPATKVAKVFGDLTGINRIFEAVREANRRRLEVGSKLKVRRADVVVFQERSQAYADLPKQRSKVKRASERYWDAVAKDTRAGAIERQVSVVRAAEAVISALVAQSPLPEVSFNGLEAKMDRLQVLARTLTTWEDATEGMAAAQEAIVELAVQEVRCDEEYDRMLKEAGTCPVCLRPF